MSSRDQLATRSVIMRSALGADRPGFIPPGSWPLCPAAPSDTRATSPGLFAAPAWKAGQGGCRVLDVQALELSPHGSASSGESRSSARASTRAGAAAQVDDTDGMSRFAEPRATAGPPSAPAQRHPTRQLLWLIGCQRVSPQAARQWQNNHLRLCPRDQVLGPIGRRAPAAHRQCAAASGRRHLEHLPQQRADRPDRARCRGWRSVHVGGRAVPRG